MPRSMNEDRTHRRVITLRRAAIEITFIIFLFYSNLLMSEFTSGRGQGKSLLFAVKDIFTPADFLIAVICGLVAYVGFEYLRKQL